MTNQWCLHTDTMHLNSVASRVDESCVCVCVCWSHGLSVMLLMLIAVALRADWARPPALTQMAHLQMQQALMCRAAEWAPRYSTSCFPSQLSVNPSLTQSLFHTLIRVIRYFSHFPLTFCLFLLSSLLFHPEWFSTCLSGAEFHSHCFPVSSFSLFALQRYICLPGIAKLIITFWFRRTEERRQKNRAYFTTTWTYGLLQESSMWGSNTHSTWHQSITGHNSHTFWGLGAL